MSHILLITGDDEPTINQEARKLVQKILGDDADDFALEVVKEDDSRKPQQVLDEVLGAVMTPPFLGGAKTVWLQSFSAFADEESAKAKNPNAIAKGIARLAEIIGEGLPDEINLVLSGPDVDLRKALAKACNAAGKVMVHNKPDVNSRNWEQDVRTLIQRQCDEKGMQLPPIAYEYLVEVIGADTGRLVQELEKIYCYAGESPTMEQVQEICTGNREAGRFAMTNAFGKRDLNAVLTSISQTMEHAKNEDSACLMATRDIARSFRKMLHVKVLMASLRVSAWDLPDKVKSMTADEKAAFSGNLAVKMSVWQLRMVGKDAANYTGQELLDSLSLLAESDRLNVSSSVPRRMALETLAVRIISGNRHKATA